MKIYYYSFLVVSVLLIVSSVNLLAQNKTFPVDHRFQPGAHKIQSNPDQSLMDINRITSWVSETGFHDWIVNGWWNGAYPNGYSVGTVFSEGIVWGGLVHDGNSQIVRVNGNTYKTGCRPVTRLYRVRKDYWTADLTSDASNFFNVPVDQVTESQINELRLQYRKDYIEWPASEGAPFDDVDDNGIYDPAVDTPGVTGSAQTLFIKYDDGLSDSLYHSNPVGLEVTETFWAYAGSGPIANIIFKKIDLRYTGIQGVPSDSYIDSMYICQWSETDVGTSVDDYVGCDTMYNLGYTYNAIPVDQLYSEINLHPPAVGYAFLQGVSAHTGNPNDSAIVNFKWQHGYAYVNKKPMTRFVYRGAGGTWSPPAFSYEGTLEFYNYMRGFRPYPPYPGSGEFPASIVDYADDGVYLLAGDPVQGTGKIDGVLDPPGNRELYISTGPFHLNLGETAEVVIALVDGLGDSNLNSITALRANTFAAHTAFWEMVKSGQVQVINVEPGSAGDTSPKDFMLSQNYPNPFNPTTNISFVIAHSSFVSLKIYDVLGDGVVSLVNEEKPEGKYTVIFNGADLPSGVYFYRLKAGSFIRTKKMILLK